MKDWIQRAVAFTRALDRFGTDTVQIAEADVPMGQRDLGQLQSQISAQIPLPIRRFLTRGSGSCRCKYVITIQGEPNDYVKANFPPEMALMIARRHVAGGAFLCNSEELAYWNSPLITETMRQANVNPAVADLWAESFFFMDIGNGDFLGLHTSADNDNPPVVYLSHEEAFYPPIAPNFTHFLTEWETIHYLDPLSWSDRGFLNRDTGYLDASAGDRDGLLQAFL